MVGKTKAATADEKRRMTILKENVPCIPCLIEHGQISLPTIQHVSRGYKRLGHGFTYSACEWHHLGLGGYQGGPSLANGRKPFERHYGPEEFLVRCADYILEAWDTQGPWLDYNVPMSVIAAVQEAHRVKVSEGEVWSRPFPDSERNTHLRC